MYIDLSQSNENNITRINRKQDKKTTKDDASKSIQKSKITTDQFKKYVVRYFQN